MKIQILLSTLLLASLATTLSAFAAPDSATQVCTGQLKGVRSVVGVYNTADLTKPITPNSATSATLTAITPAFTVTDTTKNQTLSMTASCPGSGADDAIFGVTTTEAWIAMATSTATSTAFSNTVGPSPNPTVNVDVIGFPITIPLATADISTPSAKLTYSINGFGTGWTGTIEKPGITRTNMTISGSSKPNTISYEDSADNYVATILLQFN